MLTTASIPAIQVSQHMPGIDFCHLLRRAPGTDGESSLNLRKTVIIRLVARQIPQTASKSEAPSQRGPVF
jgi:hypothetical protein